MEEKIDIWLEGKENLRKCFDLATNIHTKWCGYKIVNDEYGTRMFVYWCQPTGFDRKNDVNWLPYEMNVEEITNFIWGWLERVDYGEVPDTDGSTGKGFHFRSKDFGDLMEGCDEYAVGVIVSPEWFVYGK